MNTRIRILGLVLLPLTIQCQNATKSTALEEVPAVSEVPDHRNYALLTQRIAELAEMFDEEPMQKREDSEEYRLYFEFGWTPPAMIKVLVQEDSSELIYKYYHPDDFRMGISPEYKTRISSFTDQIELFKAEFDKLGFEKLMEVDTPDFTVLDNDRIYIEVYARGTHKLLGRMDSMENEVEDFRQYLFELIESLGE